GATHAEAGAYLLSLWGLPARVIEAVACHHLPASQLGNEFTPSVAVHLANALEYAETSGRSGFPEFRLDLDYPAELHLQEHMEEFREIVRVSSRPAVGVTQFIRKKSVEEQPFSTQPAVRLAAELSPDSWWSRFRSLLAT
ncbi:MAG TPA: HDOD domain-containing protein, partial [Verrucomicrobiae bacterium]|nr:HDOD domain-containing protein [Verrucomicrobiae bacterium]